MTVISVWLHFIVHPSQHQKSNALQVEPQLFGNYMISILLESVQTGSGLEADPADLLSQIHRLLLLL